MLVMMIRDDLGVDGDGNVDDLHLHQVREGGGVLVVQAEPINLYKIRERGFSSCM